jgi:hypothetical protein
MRGQTLGQPLVGERLIHVLSRSDGPSRMKHVTMGRTDAAQQKVLLFRFTIFCFLFFKTFLKSKI